MADERSFTLWIGLLFWRASFDRHGPSVQRYDFPMVGIGVEW